MDSELQTALRSPGLRLHGVIDESWIDRLLAASESAENALFVVEVTTTGGDAEIGRRLALEIRHWRARGGRIAFLGKTCVYSAGVVFMTGFAPEDRWLSEDCWLLVHERQMTTIDKTGWPAEGLRRSAPQGHGRSGGRYRSGTRGLQRPGRRLTSQLRRHCAPRARQLVCVSRESCRHGFGRRSVSRMIFQDQPSDLAAPP